MLTSENIKNIYPLSAMQEGMYFQALYEPESTAYFIQSAYHLKGQLDLKIFEASLDVLWERYDVLRTVFNHKKANKPLQIVLKEVPLPLQYQDLRSTSNQKEKVEQQLVADRQLGFDLNSETAARVQVLQLSDTEYRVVWSVHHIILDGWCTAILNTELYKIYLALCNDQSIDLPPTAPFSDYIQWLEKQNREEAFGYWREQLTDFDEVSHIPSDVKNTDKGFDEGIVNIELNEAQLQALDELNGKYKTTSSSAIAMLWGLTLARLKNSHDVVFGTVVSGRPSEVKGIESMIGMFVNTVPMRIRYQSDSSFAELLLKTKEYALNSTPHHYVSLAEIQSQSAVSGPLFDHVFVFENYPIVEQIDGFQNAFSNSTMATPLEITDIDDNQHTNFDFQISGHLAQGLRIKFQYNKQRHSTVLVERIAAYFETLLNAFIADPKQTIDAVQIVKTKERDLLLDWGKGEPEAFYGKTVPELIQHFAETTPNAPALVYNGKTIDYAVLNGRANQLARYIREEMKLRNGDHLALLLERSELQIIALLAALKTGVTYVPIDPEYPKERIHFLLSDADVKGVLTTSNQLTFIADFEKPLFLLDVQLTQLAHASVAPDWKIDPEGNAYMIYTSGSTGKPKGVLVPHKSMSNTLLWRKKQYNFSPADVSLQMFSFAFDGSITDIFTVLIGGGKLVIPSKEEKEDLMRMGALLTNQRVTNFIIIPSLYQTLLFQLGQVKLDLRFVTLAGEATSNQLIEEHFAAMPSVALYNEFGATENAVCSTVAALEKGSQVNIGKPIAGVEVFVLDDQLELCPIGGIGELCFAGAGLSNGYYKREQENENQFVAHPFVEGKRMYKSGDLACWNNGELEYFGRKDQQIKVNGFRIETGEVEGALKSLTLVSNAIVGKHISELGGSSLVAWITANETIETTAVKQELAKHLPKHMIPSHILIVEEFARTANGKIDRLNLPDPILENRSQRGELIEARNPAESAVLNVWKEAMEMEQIGVAESFFDLGGNSIRILKLHALMEKQFPQKFKVTDLFSHPTIEEQATFLAELNTTDTPDNNELIELEI